MSDKETPVTPQFSSDQKRDILKAYLGPFFVKVPKSIDSQLSTVGVDESAYIIAPLHLIRACGAVLLMKDGKQNYKVFNTYDLVDIFLGNSEVYSSVLDLADYPMVMLVHGFSEMENKRLPDFVAQLWAQRDFKRKRTIMLTTTDQFSELLKLYKLKRITISDIVKSSQKVRDL